MPRLSQVAESGGCPLVSMRGLFIMVAALPYQPSSICPGGLLCSAMTGSVYSSNSKPEQVPKYLLSSSTWDKELSVRNRPQKDLPGGPVLKTWLSRATGAGLILG